LNSIYKSAPLIFKRKMLRTRTRAEILSVILALSAAATAAMPVVSDVYASNAGGPPGDDDPPRNLWGKEASDLARDNEDNPDEEDSEGSEMGEHSRESDAKPNEPGRLGIGNLPGHPSESIEILCGEGGQNCPDPLPED
jgi:hypothetical protein